MSSSAPSSENSVAEAPSAKRTVHFDQLEVGKKYRIKMEPTNLVVLNNCPANNAQHLQQTPEDYMTLHNNYLVLNRGGLDPNGNKRALFDSQRVRLYPDCIVDATTLNSPEFEFLEYPEPEKAPKAMGGKRKPKRRLLNKKKSRKSPSFTRIKRNKSRRLKNRGH